MLWALVLMYLSVGGSNVAVAGVQGGLIINHGIDTASLVEVGFYLLCWPVQLAFRMLVLIHAGLGFILSKALP